MAKNKLKPESDLAAREFFLAVVEDGSFLADLPASRRDLISILLTALNYDWLPNGAFIERGQNITMTFGQADYSKYESEWDADVERANAAINDKASVKASTSGKGKSAKVRKTILPEDV